MKAKPQTQEELREMATELPISAGKIRLSPDPSRGVDGNMSVRKLALGKYRKMKKKLLDFFQFPKR